MDWSQLTHQVWDALRDHWAKGLLPLVGLLIGWWWGRRHARREWTRKQFLSRLNISLNSFEPTAAGHHLRIRTLSEKDATEILLNKIAVERMQAATRRTSESQPILPLGDDNWYVLNAVLNEISEQFATGHLRKDLGAPVHSGRYLIGMTFEHDGAMRTRKARAMVVRRDQMETLFPPHAGGEDSPEKPQFVLEKEHHRRRLLTLRQMADAWRADPSRFLEIEISV